MTTTRLRTMTLCIASALGSATLSACLHDFDVFTTQSSGAIVDASTDTSDAGPGIKADGASNLDARTTDAPQSADQFSAADSATDGPLDTGASFDAAIDQNDGGDGACTPQASCLTTARTCGQNCGSVSTACVAACSTNGCRQTCRNQETTCRAQCATTCTTCTTNAGCSAATSCTTEANR